MKLKLKSQYEEQNSANLWSCDNNGARDIGCSEQINGGQMFIGSAWRSVHDQIVQVAPVYILQESLDHF